MIAGLALLGLAGVTFLSLTVLADTIATAIKRRFEEMKNL